MPKTLIERMIDVKKLYEKERDYQLCAHGDYTQVDSLNLGSFLILIEHYLKKAKELYSGPWTGDLPDWINTCREYEQESHCPAESYEELIKVFALAGAALETYVDIDPEKWRGNIDEDLKKWQKETE
jgi:hypothetical protein